MNKGFPGDSDSKESACSVGDPGSIPGPGRSPGEGNSNPLQYSCLENPMDRGTWQATVHGVAKAQTRLSDFIFFLSFLLWVKKPSVLKSTVISGFLVLELAEMLTLDHFSRSVLWYISSCVYGLQTQHGDAWSISTYRKILFQLHKAINREVNFLAQKKNFPAL